MKKAALLLLLGPALSAGDWEAYLSTNVMPTARVSPSKYFQSSRSIDTASSPFYQVGPGVGYSWGFAEGAFKLGVKADYHVQIIKQTYTVSVKGASGFSESAPSGELKQNSFNPGILFTWVPVGGFELGLIAEERVQSLTWTGNPSLSSTDLFIGAHLTYTARYKTKEMFVRFAYLGKTTSVDETALNSLPGNSADQLKVALQKEVVTISAGLRF
jgi:hypothetical protein